MDYNKIVAVTGLSGLYEMVSSKNDGGVVRNLEDNTSKFVSNRLHSFSHLESIEVYTQADNVNLVDVFNAMKNSSETMPDANDQAAVKSYFEKVYPDMDFSRVYNSDMKKMIKWYGVLTKAGVDIKTSQAADLGDVELGSEEETDEPVKKEKKETKAKESKPEKKATATKAAKSPTAKASAPAKKVTAPRKMA